MGVGKTLQAIATQFLYRKDWPLLILSPSSLKYTWRDEILKWIPCIRLSDIQLFESGKDPFSDQAKIFIMSYDLATKRADDLKTKKFCASIADEAHYLKSYDTKRSQALSPILADCKRVILVTGTPILSRPSELFNILKILRPDIFVSFFEFSNRYCAPKQSKYGVDYKGSSCQQELHYIMSKYMMIRRLKNDVLTQLPDKRRQKIEIQVD